MPQSQRIIKRFQEAFIFLLLSIFIKRNNLLKIEQDITDRFTMESTKYSHTNTPKQTSIRTLKFTLRNLSSVCYNRPFLAEWWYFVIVIFIFLYSSLTFDAPIDPAERPSAAVSHLFFQFFNPYFMLYSFP